MNVSILKKPSFWIGTICYALSLVVIVLMFIGCFGGGLWLDEAFSFGLIEHDYFHMAYLTSGDVHPPLYYCILKFVIDVTTPFGADRLITARIVSVLPMVALFVYSLIFIRKDFGYVTGGLFMALIVAMPNVFTYSSEIRMYSWSMAFVVAALIHLYEVMKEPDQIWNWVFLSFHTLCAAYTQYFALASVGLLWLGLFIWMLIRARKYWLRFTIVAAITVALYVPWCIVILKQLGAYTGHGGMGASSMWQFYAFVFGFPMAWGSFLHFVCAFCFIVLILSIIRYRFDEANIMAIIGYLTCFAIMWVLSFITTFVSHEVFARYMFPIIGGMWYPATVLSVRLIQDVPLKKPELSFREVMPIVNGVASLVLIVSLVIGGWIEISRDYESNRAEVENYNIYKTAVIDRIEKDDVIVSENELFGLTTLKVQCPENECLAFGKEPSIGWVLEGLGSIWSDQAIVEKVESGKSVWYFGENKEQLFKSYGLSVEYVGFYAQIDMVNCAGAHVLYITKG